MNGYFQIIYPGYRPEAGNEFRKAGCYPLNPTQQAEALEHYKNGCPADKVAEQTNIKPDQLRLTLANHAGFRNRWMTIKKKRERQIQEKMLDMILNGYVEEREVLAPDDSGEMTITRIERSKKQVDAGFLRLYFALFGKGKKPANVDYSMEEMKDKIAATFKIVG